MARLQHRPKTTAALRFILDPDWAQDLQPIWHPAHPVESYSSANQRVSCIKSSMPTHTGRPRAIPAAGRITAGVGVGGLASQPAVAGYMTLSKCMRANIAAPLAKLPALVPGQMSYSPLH